MKFWYKSIHNILTYPAHSHISKEMMITHPVTSVQCWGKLHTINDVQESTEQHSGFIFTQ